jgi:transcriptional antiterminator RfaH
MAGIVKRGNALRRMIVGVAAGASVKLRVDGMFVAQEWGVTPRNEDVLSADGLRQEDPCRQVHWYAVQSKPSRELFAAANVSRLGIPVLLPKIRRRSRRGGLWRMGIKPLFTGYFFARFAPAGRLGQVRYARGVLRIVSSGRMVLPVEDAVIEAIEARTDRDGLVEIGPRPPLCAGNRVRIEAGPLEGFFGILERESDDRTRVTILLETLHTTRVVIDSDCLAKADVD